MTKVCITGLGDISIGDIIFFPGDDHYNHYRVTGIRDGHDCVELEYKRLDAKTWLRLGWYPESIIAKTYKKYEEFKYDPNQAGDTDDDI